MDSQETELDRLEEVVKSKLLRTATKGGLVANWIKHPAFQIYEEILMNTIADHKNTWLMGDDEKAKVARIEARGVMKALAVLQAIKRNGEAAKIKLKGLHEEE